MIRFALKLTLPLSILLIIFTALSVTFGRMKPQKSALVGFGYCSGVPCWMDIDLNTNDMLTADRILTLGGYQGNLGSRFYRSLDNRCDVVLMVDVYGDEVISGLQLVNCRGLFIGDLIGVFGVPNRTWVNGFCDWVLEYSRQMYIYVDGQITPGVGAVQLLPGRSVVQIDFTRQPGNTTGSGRWHGFTSFWRYAQLEPDAYSGANCG
mgnify:CR=1 FL=1